VTARTGAIDLGFKLLNVGHRLVIRVSGGRVGLRALGMEVVELETTGRVSGRRHTTLLTSPISSPDAVVLVASKGGDDRDPDWLRNLLVNPEVVVTRRGARCPMRARIATPDERAALWPQAIAAYGPYASYQRRAKRAIPLVLCELRDGAGVEPLEETAEQRDDRQEEG